MGKCYFLMVKSCYLLELGIARRKEKIIMIFFTIYCVISISFT